MTWHGNGSTTAAQGSNRRKGAIQTDSCGTAKESVVFFCLDLRQFRIEKDIDYRCSDRRRGTTNSSGTAVQVDDRDSGASCGRKRLYLWSDHGEHLPILSALT